VRNQFQLRLVNKDDQTLSYTVTAEALDGTPIIYQAITDTTPLVPMEELTRTFVVEVPRADFNGKFPLQLTFTAQPGDITVVREVEFLGPDPALLRPQQP